MNLPKKTDYKTSQGIIHLIPLVLVGAAIFAALIMSTKIKPENRREDTAVLSRESESPNVLPDTVTGTSTANKQTAGDGSDIENQLNSFISDMEKDEDEMEEIEKQEEFISQSSDEVELKSEDDKVIIKVRTKDGSGKETEKEEEASEAAYLTTSKIKVKNGEVRLKSEGGTVSLVQNLNGTENSASTRLPIALNSKDNTVTVTTDKKTVTINQYPTDVLAALTQTLDKVDSLELKSAEGQSGQDVTYHAKGVDGVKFLGMIKINAPVEADVNINDAKVTITGKPWYLKYFNFLFSDIQFRPHTP